MALSSFCGLLTLQVGVTLLSAIFFTVAGIILVANIFDYHDSFKEWHFPLILMVLFVIGLIIVGLFMFISAYNENRSMALAALLVIVVLLCYWIILCCFSFVSNPNHVKAICIVYRCPESFWIASLLYRTRKDINKTTNTTESSVSSSTLSTSPNSDRANIPEKKSKSKRAIKDNIPNGNNIFDTLKVKETKQILNLSVTNQYMEESNHPQGQESELETKLHLLLNTLPPQGANKIENLDMSFSDDYFLKDYIREKRGTKDKEPDSRVRFGLPLFGAIALFFANLIFLLFSAVIMWSWASELDWTDYYAEDEPVVTFID